MVLNYEGVVNINVTSNVFTIFWYSMCCNYWKWNVWYFDCSRHKSTWKKSRKLLILEFVEFLELILNFIWFLICTWKHHFLDSVLKFIWTFVNIWESCLLNLLVNVSGWFYECDFSLLYACYYLLNQAFFVTIWFEKAASICFFEIQWCKCTSVYLAQVPKTVLVILEISSREYITKSFTDCFNCPTLPIKNHFIDLHWLIEQYVAWTILYICYIM